MADEKVTYRLTIEDQFSAPAKAFQSSMAQTTQAMQHMGAQAEASSRNMGGFGNAVRSLTSLLNPLAAGLAAIGGAFATYKLADSFIEAASSQERFIQQINFALEPMNRYSRAGEKMDEWIDSLSVGLLRAIKSDDLNKAAVDLENFGISAYEALVPIGEAAVQMGKPISEVVQIVKMAAEGSYRGLRQMGIQASEVAKRAGVDTAEALLETEETLARGTQAVIEILRERFSGAAEASSNTWGAMMTTIGNYWDLFKEKVMESGPFEFLKEKLQLLVDWLERADMSGEMEKWAKSIGEWLTEAANTIWDWGTRVVKYLKSLSESESPLQKFFTDIIDLAKTAFETLWNYIVNVIIPWASAIGWEIGQSIIQGIINSINSMVGSLGAAVGSVFGGGTFEGGGLPNEMAPESYRGISFDFGGVQIQTQATGGEEIAIQFQERIAQDIQSGRSPIVGALREVLVE